MLSSIAVGAAVLMLMAGALAVLTLGAIGAEALFGSTPLALVLGFVLRWGVAAGLFFLAVSLVVRAGPNVERSLRWVTFGSVLVVVAWLVTSLLFGLFLRAIAGSGSVFGSFATIFVLAEYLYLSALAFLVGLLVDTVIQRRS